MAPGRLSMFRNSASIRGWFLPGNGSLVDVTMGNTPRSTAGYTKKRKYKEQRDLQEQRQDPLSLGDLPEVYLGIFTLKLLQYCTWNLWFV